MLKDDGNSAGAAASDLRREHPAVPSNGGSGMMAMSSQLNVLTERALSGAVEDINRLSKWASLVDQESQMLRRRLRKQQHDFSTLFEIVGQTSARSLDVVAMQTYLLRTISGHFAAPKLIIMRRDKAENQQLCISAAQGLKDPKHTISTDSQLCQSALERRFSFLLTDLSQAAQATPEVVSLQEMGMNLVVPLIQEIDAGANLEGFLFLGKRLSNLPYSQEDLEFLHVLGKMFAICLRNEALYRRSVIDDLTGVHSRGHFDAQLSQEINRIMTYGHRSMGLVMLDVDKFKSFNDTYGHQTGDRVLQELARTLLHQVRNVDLVARYGGEEFAIILLEIDREKILEVGERIRKAVEDMEVISIQGQRLPVTASFGIACFPDDAIDKSTLIQLADKALYRSKDGGRNRVTLTQHGAGHKRTIIMPPADASLQKKSTQASPLRSNTNLSMLSGMTPEIQNLQRQQLELAQSGDSVEPTPPLPNERRRGGLKLPDPPPNA